MALALLLLHLKNLLHPTPGVELISLPIPLGFILTIITLLQSRRFTLMPIMAMLPSACLRPTVMTS